MQPALRDLPIKFNLKIKGFNTKTHRWTRYTHSTYLPIWELNNSARCWQKMRYTSSSSRSTIFKFLAMTVAELSLQRRMVVAVTNGSLSYTEKHTTCQKNLWEMLRTIYPTVPNMGWGNSVNQLKQILKTIYFMLEWEKVYIMKNPFSSIHL